MADAERKIVFVGLGNPGKKYANTRHNYGFKVVEALAGTLGLVLHENKHYHAMTAKGRVQETEVHLLLPLTFMNASGQAVRQYLDYYKLMPRQIVVVCDDTALEFGQLRLRPQGSSGGHNGLRSVALHLGTERFARLRMGIGSKSGSQPLADYVLSDFSAEEKTLLDEYIKEGADALQSLITETIARVMGRVNTKLTFQTSKEGQENTNEPKKTKPV